MAEFKHKDKQELSRQEAAEWLIAIADALRTGGSMALGAGGQQVQIPDQVFVEREFERKGDRVEIELELSWSTADVAAPVAAPESSTIES